MRESPPPLPFPPGGGELPLANQLVPGVGGGAGVGGAGWGREHFRSLVCFSGLGWVAGCKVDTVAAAAAGSGGGVGKSCKAAAGSCAGWRAAPSCGCGSGRCALGGALRRARLGGRTGVGSWGDEGGGCSRRVCVRTRAEQHRLHRAAGRWGEKRPRERLKRGEWRARSQRQQPRRRRGSKGRAPAREL